MMKCKTVTKKVARIRQTSQTTSATEPQQACTHSWKSTERCFSAQNIKMNITPTARKPNIYKQQAAAIVHCIIHAVYTHVLCSLLSYFICHNKKYMIHIITFMNLSMNVAGYQKSNTSHKLGTHCNKIKSNLLISSSKW